MVSLWSVRCTGDLGRRERRGGAGVMHRRPAPRSIRGAGSRDPRETAPIQAATLLLILPQRHSGALLSRLGMLQPRLNYRLHGFDGEDADGTLTLNLEADINKVDGGNLNSWSIAGERRP